RELGIQLEDLAVVHPGESDERPRLSDEGRRGLTRGRPCFLITGVLDIALDLQSPILHVARGVAQRLEGDAYLHLEAPRRDAALRLPEKVRAEIVLSRHDIGARDEAA